MSSANRHHRFISSDDESDDEDLQSESGSVAEASNVLEVWDAERNNIAFDPQPTLQRISELVERETEQFLKQDPDPYDDRHPGRADPKCGLGRILKVVLKNDPFVTKLVSSYILNRDNVGLATQSARLLFNLVPGLDTAAVFQEHDDLVPHLFRVAETADEPLCYYATGLLASAMEVSEIASSYKDKNAVLVPIMLKRLKALKEQSEKVVLPLIHRPKIDGAGPFSDVKSESFESTAERPKLDAVLAAENHTKEAAEPSSSLPKSNLKHFGPSLSNPIRVGFNTASSAAKLPQSGMKRKSPPTVTPSPKKQKLIDHSNNKDWSNSSWAELEPYLIGPYYCLQPLSQEMKQRLILWYLVPVGEYQELLSHALEYKAIDLILYYVDLYKNRDVRLAFDALRYLGSLLCHKKFAFEFVNAGGVQKVLKVYRSSMASVGVSVCLYYLAYTDDVMEKICLLPDNVLEDIVLYALWLLEHSYESGRCHATTFFGCAFQYKAVVDIFDRHDGLRKLLNVISTLSILQVDEVTPPILTDDQLFTSRQAVRHVCSALKKYFETHLYMKADEQRRKNPRTFMGASPHRGSSLPPTTTAVPPYKPVKLDQKTTGEFVAGLLEVLPMHATWKPVEELVKLNGVPLLCQIVSIASEWNYTGRNETICNSLDVLQFASIIPKVPLELCDPVKLPEEHAVAISIVLGLCEGELVGDAEVQRSALNLIINCVCGPSNRYGSTVARIGDPNSHARKAVTAAELLNRLWDCVRSNNGIMTLRNLLFIKTPLTEADSIRALACKALNGLARSSIVRQMIGKMPLISSNQLHFLMQEPILQDKRAEHLKFCEFGRSLIERATGRPMISDENFDMEKLYKASIVSQTKIVYNQKELLQLFYDHLTSVGLTATAATLQKEADLPVAVEPTTPSVANRNQSRLPFTPNSTPSTVPDVPSQSVSETPSTSSQQPSTTIDSTPTASREPIRFHLNSSLPSTSAQRSFAQMRPTPVRERVGSAFISPPSAFKSRFGQSQAPTDGLDDKTPQISIDLIVTEFFRKRHALCRNPVVTCPPFSIYFPHQCPEPKLKHCAPYNLAARVYKRPIFPVGGGYDGVRCDLKYAFSRFKPVRVYKDEENEETFTCCSFSSDDAYLLLGTYAGDLKWFNRQSGVEESFQTCHSSALTHISHSRDSNLLLTSSAYVKPYSALWRVAETLEQKLAFEEDTYVEFSKCTLDRIVGTKGHEANIYDLTTGRIVTTLKDTDLANYYQLNKATFHPTEELVLSDGILWDIRTSTPVHKFDKLNQQISGLFHPRGLEVIINTEVWDIRKYHLLHTVPQLDQCKVVFSCNGDIIYGAVHQSRDGEDFEEPKIRSPFGCSFRTFDAIDYTLIATIDVKKNIFDLCADKSDNYLALIENQGSVDDLLSLEENVCRLYEVGKQRVEEEADQDEPEEENEDEDDEDDDDESLSLDGDENEADRLDLSSGEDSDADGSEGLADELDSSDEGEDNNDGEVEDIAAGEISSDDEDYSPGDSDASGAAELQALLEDLS